MEAFDSLPSRPLRQSDVEHLRADETVDGFIELEPQTLRRDGGLRNAVGLTESTVINLSFEHGTWNRQVLARDADDQRHLEEALDQLNLD